MDVQRKKTAKKNSPHLLWAAVLISAGVVIMAWALWFYPQNNDGLDKQGIASYRQVAEKIKDALSIFNAQKQTARTNSVDIDDLRARVFGDTVAR